MKGALFMGQEAILQIIILVAAALIVLLIASGFLGDLPAKVMG